MNARTKSFAWALLDVLALVVSAVLVGTAHAPPSMLVSVVTVLVAVRAGKRGARDDDDDGDDSNNAAPPGTPRLGGAPRASTPDEQASSALVMIARGVARWGRDLSRRVDVLDVATALVIGLALAVMTACQGAVPLDFPALITRR